MSLGELVGAVRRRQIDHFSQIERNETNPTIGTVLRLSRALDTTIDEVLKVDDASIFVEHQTRSGIPILESQDGLCRLAITGPLNLVDWICNGTISRQGRAACSSPIRIRRAPSSISICSPARSRSPSARRSRTAQAGEAIRYRGDRPHRLVNTGTIDAHAHMILVLKTP